MSSKPRCSLLPQHHWYQNWLFRVQIDEVKIYRLPTREAELFSSTQSALKSIILSTKIRHCMPNLFMLVKCRCSGATSYCIMNSGLKFMWYQMCDMSAHPFVLVSDYIFLCFFQVKDRNIMLLNGQWTFASLVLLQLLLILE